MRLGITVPAAVLALMASFAHATCSTRSAANHPHLVELYTSEGCSSCPPAEKWMSSLRGKSDIVGLEFHVDYWDTNDWRDPFDNHAYTKRQIALARRTREGQDYTPQIWLDGQLWYNWPRGTPPALYQGAAPTLQLDVQKDAGLRAHVDVSGMHGDADALHTYVALTENGLSENVKGGENRGKTLAHDEVVRAFAGPLSLPQASAELELPATINLAQSSVVAFVQDDRNGNVVQVARVPLAGCGLAQAQNPAQ